MLKTSAPFTMNRLKKKEPFVTPIFLKIAKRLGARILLEPEYGFVGHITFANGRTAFFRNANLDINPLGAIEIAKDKDYASFFLSKFGYPVPEGSTFFSEKLCKHVTNPRNIHDGYVYAKKLGFPVIVKPNNRSLGKNVTKVYTKKEYYRIARYILRTESVYLVQRYYHMNDYRLVVLDNEVISAYQRIPLHVIGDGEHTVPELLFLKQQEYEKHGRDTEIDFNDVRIRHKLKRQGLLLSSIIPKGQIVQLLDNANLSSGGEAIDLTLQVSSEWKALAINLTKKMGLRLCGVDILTTEITKKPEIYIILEINGSPGLDNYASIGQTQAKIVENRLLAV